MPTGGARHRSGPPPSSDSDQWIRIPNTPCDEQPPSFPLPDPSERELYLWKKLWVKPQARMWHLNDLDYEVALYTRRFAEAEQADSSVTLNTLVRQLADSIGVTVPGMRSARWLLVADVINVEQPKQKAIPSAKDRFALKQGDG